MRFGVTSYRKDAKWASVVLLDPKQETPIYTPNPPAKNFWSLTFPSTVR
jgi:hypothetical protein